MKAIFKGLIIGGIIVAIGIGILITALAINGWTFKTTFTTQSYTAENENSSVKLDIGASTLVTEFYDGDRIEISYPESNRIKTDITERDGKLTFKSKVKWFAHLTINADIPQTVVRLPKDKVFDFEVDLGAGTARIAGGVYGKVAIDVGAGKLEGADIECKDLDCDISAGTVNLTGVVCTSLKCDVSAGTVNLNGVTCSSLKCDVSAGKLDISSLTCPEIRADVSAGKLSLGVNGIKDEYTIKSKVSAGSCNVSNQSGSTDKKLTVECSAGEISVNFAG